MYMDLLILAFAAFNGLNCVYHVIYKPYKARKRKDETPPTRVTDDSE